MHDCGNILSKVKIDCASSAANSRLSPRQMTGYFLPDFGVYHNGFCPILVRGMKAVKVVEEAVNLGNSRVLCPPSLSNRRELIGTLPAFIVSNRIKNPTQIGSFSKSSKKHLRRSVTFSLIFDRSEHPPLYAVI